MRRYAAGKAAVHPKKWSFLRKAALPSLLLWLLLATLWYVEDRFEPTLDKLAEYEAAAMVAQAVGAAIGQAGQETPQLYAGLYTLERDAAGAIQAVRTDAAALNRARIALLAAVEESLCALPEREIQVPFGTLTGFSLLNGFGPGWTFRLRPDAYAEAMVEEKAEAVAINGRRYTAELVLRVTINMVLDGRNRILYYSCRVPLASILVDGETPIYYGS